MPNTDPHTFNTTLAAVGRAMSEPVSAELAAAYERIGELEAALRKVAGLSACVVVVSNPILHVKMLRSVYDFAHAALNTSVQS